MKLIEFLDKNEEVAQADRLATHRPTLTHLEIGIVSPRSIGGNLSRVHGYGIPSEETITTEHSRHTVAMAGSSRASGHLLKITRSGLIAVHSTVVTQKADQLLLRHSYDRIDVINRGYTFDVHTTSGFRATDPETGTYNTGETMNIRVGVASIRAVLATLPNQGARRALLT